MLAARRVNLIYEPPYHPQFNTCEFCFRQLKGWLRKHSQFAETHTEIAIFHGLSIITSAMSAVISTNCSKNVKEYECIQHKEVKELDQIIYFPNIVTQHLPSTNDTTRNLAF